MTETEQIRREIWKRQNGECIRCGDLITWKTAHMHERLTRGRGGKISVNNSELLCADCHIGVRGVHGNRRPQFTQRTTEVV